MTYEHIPNDRIVAGIAVPGVFTSYALRMAAGERIQQQATEIERLREAAKGATVIVNVASAEIRKLRRLVRDEYVDDVACMCRLCYAEWGEDEAETHQAGCMAAERPAR